MWERKSSGILTKQIGRRILNTVEEENVSVLVVPTLLYGGQVWGARVGDKKKWK